MSKNPTHILSPSDRLFTPHSQLSVAIFTMQISSQNEMYKLQTPSSEVNWSELPDNLLTTIHTKLINNIIDYIRFGSVCHSWYSIYTQSLHHHHHHHHHQLPLLMLTTELDNYDQTRSFYSISKSRLSNFRVPFPHYKLCRGSTLGWLVMVDKDSYDVYLFNPFVSVNGIEILLPPLTAFENFPSHAVSTEYCLVKAVLSSDPVFESDYVVMAIYGGYHRLAFYKPGGKMRWVSLDERSFANIIYFKDRFYVVDREGALFVCDPKLKLPITMIAPGLYENDVNQIYLVECCGELLQVKREVKYASPVYFTTGFEVFKFDFVDSKWVQVKGLFGQVLFVGDNSSISLPVSDLPGCERNCIFFTDDNYYWYELSPKDTNYDTGVFSLENGSIDRHYGMKSKMKFPPPVWVEPTLRRRFNRSICVAFVS